MRDFSQGRSGENNSDVIVGFIYLIIVNLLSLGWTNCDFVNSRSVPICWVFVFVLFFGLLLHAAAHIENSKCVTPPHGRRVTYFLPYFAILATGRSADTLLERLRTPFFQAGLYIFT